MIRVRSFLNRRNDPRTQRLINWAATILWAGIIFYMSSLSDLSIRPGGILIPKLAHVTEYAVLTALLIRALRHPRRPASRVLGMAALIALAYAGSDEFHQSFVKNRHPALLDVLIDSVGITAAVAISRRGAPRERG